MLTHFTQDVLINWNFMFANHNARYYLLLLVELKELLLANLLQAKPFCIACEQAFHHLFGYMRNRFWDGVVESENFFVQAGSVGILYHNISTQNGSVPQTMAYKITPALQRSTCSPLYFFPAIISGAAQHGLPQAVFNYSFFGVSLCCAPASSTLK